MHFDKKNKKNAAAAQSARPSGHAAPEWRRSQRDIRQRGPRAAPFEKENSAVLSSVDHVKKNNKRKIKISCFLVWFPAPALALSSLAFTPVVQEWHHDPRVHLRGREKPPEPCQHPHDVIMWRRHEFGIYKSHVHAWTALGSFPTPKKNKVASVFSTSKCCRHIQNVVI